MVNKKHTLDKLLKSKQRFIDLFSQMIKNGCKKHPVKFELIDFDNDLDNEFFHVKIHYQSKSYLGWNIRCYYKNSFVVLESVFTFFYNSDKEIRHLYKSNTWQFELQKEMRNEVD